MTNLKEQREAIREKVYDLVKEVHIQKPFEDVTGEPHYVTDEVMKILLAHEERLVARVIEAIDTASVELNELDWSRLKYQYKVALTLPITDEKV